MGRMVDLAGKRVGRLTVLRPVGRNAWGNYIWECQCDCGNRHKVAAGDLKNLSTHSCGCLHREELAKMSTTHGYTSGPTRSQIYTIWGSMLNRTKCPSCRGFKNYGGRGIKVCDRWKRFENFLEDMGERPGKGYSIERINNDGDYEPGNCRWATSKEQNTNTRRVVLTTIDGKTDSMAGWAKIYKFKLDSRFYALAEELGSKQLAVTELVRDRQYERLTQQVSRLQAGATFLSRIL